MYVRVYTHTYIYIYIPTHAYFGVLGPRDVYRFQAEKNFMSAFEPVRFHVFPKP